MGHSACAKRHFDVLGDFAFSFFKNYTVKCLDSVVYQGPNQTNQDSIKAWLKHEEPNSTRQQQEVINQTLAPARLNTACNCHNENGRIQTQKDSKHSL